ncbi:MAG: DNA polymerase III subunit gamma/tau, partial [Thermoguttaceae bacterium]|nr:DNA polymerase III subunit gamma/tau [Thermoguttaceae bacterium]
EIRQLRQNVNIRPSRARFKIYIIDEVHMLTREAFNALLKTLEEPPEHVKFIFCTTEPTKIPITILSRCQRFDFAGISRDAIADRLRQIVAAEGVEAEPEALDLLARRAAGSMRDSQSLLEQLLAFSADRITTATVHSMLGTAGEDQILRLLEHLAGRNSAGALGELDAAVGAGVDVALLLEQLLGILRDAMAAAAGCTHETFLFVSASSAQAVTDAAKRMGLLSILAAMQIVEQALSHMRQSTQGRILAELALVRICYLEELDELPELIAQLRSGGLPGSTGPAAAPAGEVRGKKNVESALGADPGHRAAAAAASGATVALSNENAAEVWRSALKHISVMAAAQGGLFDEAKADGPGRLVISFRAEYALAKSFCERPEHTLKFEEALKEVTGYPVRVRFAESGPQDGPDSPGTSPTSRVSPQQRLKEVMDNPVVRRVHELFGATPLRVDGPDG